MSKRLIHWARPDGIEEAAIKKVARELDLEEEHAAEIIDDTFKYYRKISTSDITLPDIYIGNLLSIKPNVHRITRAIKNYIYQCKAGIIHKLVLDYRIFPLWHVRRRLLNHKFLSSKEKREVSLAWKNDKKKFIEEGTTKRKQKYIDKGLRAQYYTFDKYKKYIRIKSINSWMDVKRKKKFNKKYRNG